MGSSPSWPWPSRSRPSGTDVFPFPARIDKLENGLKIVSIPLANPDIIAYYTIVRSGSRNEIEPGKSGFAHLFEHLMFKGTRQMPKAAYDEFLTRLGAGTNGFTADDYTCYSVIFAGRENLEEVVKAEADRFINLAYTEDTIKTEAPVIEGEYYTSAANPDRRLIELLRDTAYSTLIPTSTPPWASSRTSRTCPTSSNTASSTRSGSTRRTTPSCSWPAISIRPG